MGLDDGNPALGINPKAWTGEAGREAERLGSWEKGQGSEPCEPLNEPAGKSERSTFNQQLPTSKEDRRRGERAERRRQWAEGEAKFIDALLRFTRGAKRSRVPEIAVAARRWEGKIHFQIQITSQRRDRKGRASGRMGK